MKNFFKIIFLIFIFSLNSCSSKDDIAKIFFFDVNQGDSSFVTYNNISILIDTGEKIFTNDVIKILKSKNIKNIDTPAVYKQQINQILFSYSLNALSCLLS